MGSDHRPRSVTDGLHRREAWARREDAALPRPPGLAALGIESSGHDCRSDMRLVGCVLGRAVFWHQRLRNDADQTGNNLETSSTLCNLQECPVIVAFRRSLNSPDWALFPQSGWKTQVRFIDAIPHFCTISPPLLQRSFVVADSSTRAARSRCRCTIWSAETRALLD